MSDRQPWELDDDKLFEAEGKGFMDWVIAGSPINTMGAPLYEPFQRRTIATAAQKKLWQHIKQEWPKSTYYAEECSICVDEVLQQSLDAALGVKQ